MKKIICIVLLILVITGVVGYFVYRSNITPKDTTNENKQNNETQLILKSKAEVIEQLKKGGVEAKYIGDKDGCWQFEGNNNQTYSYCLDDGILLGRDNTN